MSGVKNRVTVKGTVQARKTVRGGIGYRTLQGEPGKDGISPQARVEKSGDTTTITIIDAEGTTTATVKDGQTPQKGVDYLTPEEVHEVAEEVLQDEIITDIQDDISDLKETLTNKLDAPQTAGTQGQVLTSDGNGGQSWEDPTGGVTDVQIDGTSVVTDGVANVPVANGLARLGLVQTSALNGIRSNSSGMIYIFSASEGELKSGTHKYNPVVSTNAYAAAFYGLAKAAGDTTQSQSSNAVGTYTDNAKAAIKAMLDITGECQTVTVTGTTPTITATQNTRYICGEVTTLDFTPSANGICDVIFTSGSTATVLTLPNTVILPSWFDATALEANTTYEISILDGVYGAVMVWQ